VVLDSQKETANRQAESSAAAHGGVLLKGSVDKFSRKFSSLYLSKDKKKDCSRLLH